MNVSAQSRWPLLGLASASCLVNLLLFLREFPLATWWQHARLDYAWLSRYELAGQVRFLGGFALLFLLYYAALQRLRQQPTAGPLWLILAGQALIGAPLLGIYPIAALDLFDYLLYGRLAVYWGANPLAEPPSHYPAEPMVAYSYWPNEPSVYGPFWQAVSEWVTVLVDGRLPDGLYAFKLLALVAALATTALIWVGLRRLAPAAAPAGALLYGWNPLQLFETAGNGHNDALMVAFLGLALVLLVADRTWLVLPAQTAALLVKITVAPLGPLLLLATVSRPAGRAARLRVLAGGGLASLALAALCYAPYWRGRASLPFLDRGNWFTASPPTLLRELLRNWLEFEAAGRVAALLCAALFGAILLVLLVHYYRSSRSAAAGELARLTVRTGYHLFFAYLFIACLWWQPWYLLVLLCLAALSDDPALADRANLFCIGGLLSYPVFKFIWSVYQQAWALDYFKIMALSVVAIFSLPLGHLLVSSLPGLLGRERRASADPVGA